MSLLECFAGYYSPANRKGVTRGVSNHVEDAPGRKVVCPTRVTADMARAEARTAEQPASSPSPLSPENREKRPGTDAALGGDAHVERRLASRNSECEHRIMSRVTPRTMIAIPTAAVREIADLTGAAAKLGT